MAATDFVDLLEQSQVVDRALGDIHPTGNPHIQTDPRNIARVAAALSERLQTLDAAQADYYAVRYADFSVRWEEAVMRWSTRAESLRGQAIVIHHKSWVYMVDWLGLNVVAALEPKPGIPPSTSHLAGMLEQLSNEDIRLIVRSAYQNSRGSHWLSDRTGIPAAVVPHSVGSVDGTDDLFGMFDVMIDRLLEPRE